MIRILEGPLREVEKLANSMEAEGWSPLGPAQFTGVSPTTGAKLVVLTMLRYCEQEKAVPIEPERLTACSLNSVGGGDD